MGPILGAILTIALNGGSISQGMVLLAAYSAGLAIPFLFAATANQPGEPARPKIQPCNGMIVEKVMGVVLIILGIMLFYRSFPENLLQPCLILWNL